VARLPKDFAGPRVGEHEVVIRPVIRALVVALKLAGHPVGHPPGTIP
jgi:hypothetical protein